MIGVAVLVELRRHSFTKKGDARGRGSHLSAEGVRAARAVGEAAGPFDRVWASTSPRTLETALAMGRAVDDTIEMPSPVETGAIEFHEWRTWPDPFTTMRSRADDVPAVADYLAAQAALVRGLGSALGEDGRALVVGHGGWIESVVAGLLDADTLPTLGGSFWHLDAVRLSVAADGVAVVASIERFPRPSPASTSR